MAIPHTLQIEGAEVTGVVRTWERDSAAETFAVKTTQDITDLVESNKRVFNSVDERAPWKGTRVHVARIPNVIMFELMKKGIANDDKAFGAWLDDPDNRVFRTRPGRVGAMLRPRS